MSLGIIKQQAICKTGTQATVQHFPSSNIIINFLQHNQIEAIIHIYIYTLHICKNKLFILLNYSLHCSLEKMHVIVSKQWAFSHIRDHQIKRDIDENMNFPKFYLHCMTPAGILFVEWKTETLSGMLWLTRSYPVFGYSSN